MRAFILGAMCVFTLFAATSCLVSQPFPDVPECVWVTVSPASGTCVWTISTNKQITVDDTGANNYTYKGKQYTWSQLAIMSVVVPPDSDASIKTWEQAECHQAGNCVNVGNWNLLNRQMEKNKSMVDSMQFSPILFDRAPEAVTPQEDPQ